eukprot:403358170
MLNCGHSYCENCIKLMFKPANKSLQCPSCLFNHPFEKLEDLSKLIKNYTLISILEAARYGNTPTPGPDGKTKSKTQNQNQKSGLGRSKTSVGSKGSTSFHKRRQGGTFDQDLNELEECKSEDGAEYEDGSEEEFIEEDEDGNQIICKRQKNRERNDGGIGGMLKQQQASKQQVIPPKIQYNQKCQSHDMLIHSFIRDSKELLCTKCIYEQNLQSSQIEVFPQVIKDIKQSIESTRIMILYRRTQLIQSLKYFERMQRGNREVIENKLIEHVNKLRRVVDGFEQKMQSQLDQLFDEQNVKLIQVQSQVEEHLDKLQNADLNMSSLESHDDNEIIYMTKIIEDQRAPLVNFKFDEIQFDEISIALQLRESAYEKLDGLLTSTCNLVLDNLRLDDESPMRFENIIDKEKVWICNNCNILHSYDVVYCEKCQIFRPLEMYKNLLHNPMNITDDELQSLHERRKREKQLILDKDLDGQNEQVWFMISSEWLTSWKCFISNRISNQSSKIEISQSNLAQDSNQLPIRSQARVSENPKIGVLPPGPISNDDLFIKVIDGKDSSTQIREGLELNKHYRGVNKEVWQIFHRMYGGGPIIIRQELDIYSRDISKDLQQNSGVKRKEFTSKKRGQSGNRGQPGNNIFARISSPSNSNQQNQQQQNPRKKRNLFLSENIGLDEEDGIPEEHIEVQQQSNPRLGNFSQRLKNQKSQIVESNYSYQQSMPNSVIGLGSIQLSQIYNNSNHNSQQNQLDDSNMSRKDSGVLIYRGGNGNNSSIIRQRPRLDKPPSDERDKSNDRSPLKIQSKQVIGRRM